MFGPVASGPTVSRLIDTLPLPGRRPCRRSVPRGPKTVSGSGGWPSDADGTVTVDLDGVLVITHSDKEDAAPAWKRSYGHHPLTAFVDHGPGGTGEPVAALLRPGNAGSNTAADRITTAQLALAQTLTRFRRGRRTLIRTDSAVGTHDFARTLPYGVPRPQRAAGAAGRLRRPGQGGGSLLARRRTTMRSCPFDGLLYPNTPSPAKKAPDDRSEPLISCGPPSSGKTLDVVSRAQTAFRHRTGVALVTVDHSIGAHLASTEMHHPTGGRISRSARNRLSACSRNLQEFWWTDGDFQNPARGAAKTMKTRLEIENKLPFTLFTSGATGPLPSGRTSPTFPAEVPSKGPES